MPKGLTLCTQCGYSYTTHHSECLNCGKVREPKRTLSTVVVCDWAGCGAKIGRRGIGMHMRRHRNEAAGVPNAYGSRTEKTAALGGTWTVSLVNGKRQIAATVDTAAAQKIIAILAG